jgi:hypothetical protein
MLLDFVALNIAIDRASKRNYATLRWNKTALGPQGQAETSLNIEGYTEAVSFKVLFNTVYKYLTNNIIGFTCF